LEGESDCHSDGLKQGCGNAGEWMDRSQTKARRPGIDLVHIFVV
jgi:hypothetical protein